MNLHASSCKRGAEQRLARINAQVKDQGSTRKPSPKQGRHSRLKDLILPAGGFLAALEQPQENEATHRHGSPELAAIHPTPHKRGVLHSLKLGLGGWGLLGRKKELSEALKIFLLAL